MNEKRVFAIVAHVALKPYYVMSIQSFGAIWLNPANVLLKFFWCSICICFCDNAARSKPANSLLGLPYIPVTILLYEFCDVLDSNAVYIIQFWDICGRYMQLTWLLQLADKMKGQWSKGRGSVSKVSKADLEQVFGLNKHTVVHRILNQHPLLVFLWFGFRSLQIQGLLGRGQ